MTKLAPTAQTEALPAPLVPSSTQEFESLFVAEFAFICRTLQRLGVREADVHDIAQELFLAVYRALPEWDRSRPQKPWLFGFAVRFASNYRRLGWHRGRALDEDVAVPSPRLNDRIAAKRTVMRALETLDFDKRVALVMHDVEEFTADSAFASPSCLSFPSPLVPMRRIWAGGTTAPHRAATAARSRAATP